MSPIAIFSGSAHPGLAQEICAKLEAPLLPTKLKRFSNDCMEVQLQANCREQDVFLIQPLSSPVQDHLVDSPSMLDAALVLLAARITAWIFTMPMRDPTRRTRLAFRSAAVWSPTCW